MKTTNTLNSSMPPRLHITGDDEDPDPLIMQHFIEEGFDVTYLPRGNGGKEYTEELKRLADDLELGENYAIIGTFLQIKLVPCEHYLTSLIDSIR